MRLKAFSFLEVLVAIIISGIVVSTAYSVYVFTHQQFNKFTSVKSEIRNYFELSSVLNRDFEMAKKIIKKNEETIVIEFIDQTINYSFNQDVIIRTIDTHTDTFFFGVTNIESTIVNEFSEEALIDYFKVTIKDKSLSFYKNYGAIVKIEE